MDVLELSDYVKILKLKSKLAIQVLKYQYDHQYIINQCLNNV